MRGEVDKLKVLIALIIFFQGFSIAVVANPLLKANPWLRVLGGFMMVGGVLYIYFKYHTARLERQQQEEEVQTKEQTIYQRLGRKGHVKVTLPTKLKGAQESEPPVEVSLLTRFMNGITKRSEKISPYILPFIGAIIIDAVIIYNILQNQSIDVRSWDMITILFGVSLIVYNYVPEQYGFARDFFVFFLGLLFLILVFPPIFYELFLGEGGSAEVTKVLLADPVSGLLNLVGIDSSSRIVDGATVPVATVFFPLAKTGQEASVGIGEACSGIYTASIFLAAFITFVLIEYKRFDVKVGIIIGVGIFVTYFANILRMTIIILVGHFYDTNPVDLSNMNYAHINAGWLIFMAWIIPFWWLMYRFLMRKDLSKAEDGDV